MSEELGYFLGKLMLGCAFGINVGLWQHNLNAGVAAFLFVNIFHFSCEE